MFFSLSQHLDDPRRAVPKVFPYLDIEPRFQEKRLSFLYLAAVHSDDDGERAVDLVCSLDDSLGYDVAAHDAAENVDEDPFDVVVLEDDLERFGNLFPGGASPHIQEVGRFAAELLED